MDKLYEFVIGYYCAGVVKANNIKEAKQKILNSFKEYIDEEDICFDEQINIQEADFDEFDVWNIIL